MTSRLLPLLAAASLLAGCLQKNSGSIKPVGICAPNTDAAVCSSNGSCSMFMAGQGGFYLSNSTGNTPFMGFFMQFDNQLEDNSESDVKPNTNDAWIEGVSLTYGVHGALTLPGTSSATVSTLVRTRSNATPFVYLFPAEYMPTLRAAFAGVTAPVLVDVTIRATGKYVDLSEFETGPITYPVWVVNGISPPVTCEDGSAPTEFCPVEGVGGATFACGGGGTATTYTIGGSIQGLGSNTGLRLSCAGLSDFNVAANATIFTFSQGLADGASYNCSVSQSPTGLSCDMGVTGSGTVNGANVTSIVVTCS